MNMDEKKLENGARALADDELDVVNGGVGISAENLKTFVKLAGDLKDRLFRGEEE